MGGRHYRSVRGVRRRSVWVCQLCVGAEGDTNRDTVMVSFKSQWQI